MPAAIGTQRPRDPARARQLEPGILATTVALMAEPVARTVPSTGRERAHGAKVSYGRHRLESQCL
jgi:hypothetical protein